MRKFFLIFVIFIAATLQGFSQARLFYTEQEIRDEYNFLNWMSSYGEDSGLKTIQADWGSIKILHTFNSYNQCIMTMVYPKTEQEFDRRVKEYSAQNKIIDKNHWVESSGIHIEVIDVDAGKAFVIWK